MSTIITEPEIIYPESDGKPIAENTIQYRYIVTIHGNVGAIVALDPNVLICAVDNITAWVNGKKVIERSSDYRSLYRQDRYRANVELPAGESTLLLKLTKTRPDEGQQAAAARSGRPGGLIACECEKHQGMHVNVDSIYTEVQASQPDRLAILNGSDDPKGSGTAGKDRLVCLRGQTLVASAAVVRQGERPDLRQRPQAHRHGHHQAVRSES